MIPHGGATRSCWLKTPSERNFLVDRRSLYLAEQNNNRSDWPRRGDMLATIFNLGKRIVRQGVQWLNQKLQQWTRPTEGRVVLESVSDLLRDMPELVLENALLRQQVIIL